MDKKFNVKKTTFSSSKIHDFIPHFEFEQISKFLLQNIRKVHSSIFCSQSLHGMLWARTITLERAKIRFFQKMLPYFVFLFQQWIFYPVLQTWCRKDLLTEVNKSWNYKNSSKGATFPKSFRCEFYYNISARASKTSTSKNTSPFFSIFGARKSYQQPLGEATNSPPPHPPSLSSSTILTSNTTK